MDSEQHAAFVEDPDEAWAIDVDTVPLMDGVVILLMRDKDTSGVQSRSHRCGSLISIIRDGKQSQPNR
eukprot:gene35348-39986_t